MSESPIEYKSLRFELILTLILAVTFFLGGFFIGQIALPITEFNLIVVLLVFAGLPILVMFLGLYIGWWTKANIVTYNPPEWEYQPIGLSLDESSKLISDHNRRHIRVIGYSNFWFFFLPPILAIVSLGLPFYSFYEDPSLQFFVPISFATILCVSLLISEYGSFRAASNAASKDFTLPLIREAIELARTQSKVVGISKIHVVLDHASYGDYNVYRNPRVVARTPVIENDAYIESATEDLGAIDRLLIYLNLTSDPDKIIWWWHSRDRTFRKYIGDDKEGYYVRSPVPSLNVELGVKDVKLVTENAVAILLREWISVCGKNRELEDILSKLGVNKIQHHKS
jgi:hypothetical protein